MKTHAKMPTIAAVLLGFLATAPAFAGCEGCCGPIEPGPTGSSSGSGIPTASGTTTSSTTVEKSPTFPTPQKAADEGLLRLKGLVDDETATELGFASGAEAQSATLGTPVEQRFVRLSALKAYKAGAPVESVAPEVTHWIYPVLAGEQTKCQVWVEKVKEGFAPTQLGRPKAAKKAVTSQSDFAKQAKRRREQVYFLWIPALNTRVAVTGSGADAQMGFAGAKSKFDKWEGKITSSADMLSALADAAKLVQDEPH
ncbi:MAG: hypothetical protein IPK82_24925 [Polyangiaceae bacterium]|nr:hypothetical protein [Polyangiaceae bacterium]